MKFLRHRLTSLDPRLARLVLLAGTPEGAESTEGDEEENKNSSSTENQPGTSGTRRDQEAENTLKEQIDKILENPIHTSARELRFLEKNVSQLDESQQTKYRDLIGYALTLARGKGMEDAPPRLLVAAKQQSKLWKLLPPKMRKEIESELDEQIQTLKKISAKNPKAWTTLQTAKICTLYRRIRSKESVTQGGELRPEFEKIEKRLIDRAANLLSRYKTIGGKVVEVIGQKEEDKKPLTMTDRILILEIKKMFPDASEWGDARHFSDWEALAGGVIQEIFDTQGSLQADPQLFATWELVAEFLQEDGETLMGKKLPPEKKEQLQKFVTRGNAAQFLQFARKQPIFLPSHLRALQAILRDPDTLLFDPVSEADWQEYSPLSQEVNRLSKEIYDIKKEHTQQESAEIKKFLTDHPENDNAVMYQDAVQKKEALVQDLWDQFFSEETLNELLEGLGDQKTVENTWVQKLAQMRQAKKDGTITEEEFQKFEDNRLQIIDQHKKQLEKTKKSFSDFQEKVSAASTTDEKETLIEQFQLELSMHLLYQKNREGLHKELPWITAFEKAFEKYKSEKSEIEKDQEAAKKGFPFSKATTAKIEELQTKQETLEKQRAAQMKEMTLFSEWKETFEQPKKQAEGIQNTYFASLQHRVQTHNLHAADFGILWDEEIREGSAEKFSALEGVPEWKKIEAFRQKFHGVIGSLFEGVTLPELGQGDDRFQPWYQALDEKLSYSSLLTELKAEGFDLRKEFGPPQQLGQLLEGAIQHFQSDILDQVLPNISSEERREFVAGWDRIHRGLHSKNKDIEAINSAYSKHVSEKKDMIHHLEDTHQEHKAFVDNIRKKAEETDDPALKEHLIAEAKKLERTFAYQREGYLHGRNISELTPEGKENKFWLPGREILEELALQSSVVTDGVKQVSEKFRVELSEIGEMYRRMSQEKNEEERYLQGRRAKEQLRDILKDWPQMRGELQHLLGEMGSIMEAVIPAESAPHNFIETYLRFPTQAIKKLDEAFDTLSAEAQKRDFEFTGRESLWKVFPRQFQVIQSFLDFRNGDMANEVDAWDESFKKSQRATGFLERNDFFSDTTAGKEKFRERFESIRAAYRKHFKDYEDNLRSIERRIRKDARSLNTEDFYQKYGFEKEFIEENLQLHRDQSARFRSQAEPFLDQKFLSDWLQKYEESDQARAEALERLGDFQRLGDTAEQAKKTAAEFDTWIAEYDKQKNQPRFKHNYTRFSFYDIYALVKQAVEINDTRHKRKSDRAIGALGTEFFGEGSGWGKDFRRKLEESETQRIKEFEQQYHDQEGWTIKNRLYKSNDADEARACINLLNERGYLKWDDPELWKTLERLQQKPPLERFSPRDLETLSYKEILDKVRNAAEFVWSKEVFREWETSMPQKLKSVIDSYEMEFSSYEDDNEARSAILTDMLRRWKRGDMTNVDPARFEAFIWHSFAAGKMNGQPDQRFWFLIQGAACRNPQGQPLLSRNVLMRMNREYLYLFPHVDFFADKESWKLNGRIVPEGTPGAHPGGWTYEDYLGWAEMLGDSNGTFDVRQEPGNSNMIRFFYDVIHQSPTANGRVRRAVRGAQAKFDHDDAQAFSAEFTTNDVNRSLSLESSQKEKMTTDFWRRFLDGYRLFFQQTYQIIRDGDQQYGENPRWQKKRDKMILEVGDRLRAAFATVQTLLGNFTTGNHGSLTFTDEEWEFDSNYSSRASVIRDMVHDFMGGFLRESKMDSKYGYLLSLNGKKEGLDPKGKGERTEKVHKEVESLIQGTEGDAMFRNKDLVWKQLQRMFHAGKFELGASMGRPGLDLPPGMEETRGGGEGDAGEGGLGMDA